MEHSISILLGVIVSIVIAGVATIYLTDYAGSINDDYDVVSYVRIHRDSSVSIITVAYTNGGIHPIVSFDGAIPSCSCSHSSGSIDTGPHTSDIISWHEFGKDVSGIIQMQYTFEDGTVITDIQKLGS